jgi:diguanylate cyclase (GGDEF)-like protein
MLMIYGLLCLVAVLTAYILLLHFKLHEMKELVQESHILMTGDTNIGKQTYYLKFNVDKDFKITKVNGDILSYGNFRREDLLGHPAIGTVMSDIAGNSEFLAEIWKRLKSKKRIITSEQVLQKSDGTPVPVLLRARPILNELLHCKGISFWGYPLKQQINLEKQLKDLQQKDKVIGEILNAESFYDYLEQQVKICNRYNYPLLLIVVELGDVHNFVNNGFSFDTGDKLLRLAADACIESVGTTAKIGRFEHTKIGMIMRQYDEKDIVKSAQIIRDAIVEKIRKLNVDKVNAEMIDVFYLQCRGGNDTAETMLSSCRKYLQNSLKIHRYGVGTLRR